MKKFLFLLIPSILIIAGIWIIPNMGTSKYKGGPEAFGEADTTEVFMWSPDYGDEEEAMIPEMAAPPEEVIAYTSPSINWKELITWIIGSLNGIFGMVLLIKKVFNK